MSAHALPQMRVDNEEQRDSDVSEARKELEPPSAPDSAKDSDHVSHSSESSLYQMNVLTTPTFMRKREEKEANVERKINKSELMKTIFNLFSPKKQATLQDQEGYSAQNDSPPYSDRGSFANLINLFKTPSRRESLAHFDYNSSSDNQKNPKVESINGSNSSLLSRLNASRFLSKSRDSISIPISDRIDSFIKRILNNADTSIEAFPLSHEEIGIICNEASELTLSQPILLRLNCPTYICGDIHGQFTDLLKIFEICGDPKDVNYLFLGDYVDRGKQSMETILLLMCYKIKYPETFFLLRGNHEVGVINRVYGFYDECKRRAKVKTWKMITEYFNLLPLAAIVGDRLFCVHGGLSPRLQSMNDITSLRRPLTINRIGVEADLLWSDPAEGVTAWAENEDRGLSFVFGPTQIDNFLRKFDFDLIVRAHMVVEDGYEFFHGRKLLTIFSAPNYCGLFDNHGAVLHVDEQLQASFKFLPGKALHKSLPTLSTD